MSDEDKIIPFGKYKGQEIEIVRQRDPQYLQWLTQQAWFAEKFAPIYQVVINNFSNASEDTPAHNAIQVRFLDAEFREAFWVWADLVDEKLRAWLRSTFRLNMGRARCAPQPFIHRAYVRKAQDRSDSWVHQAYERHRAEVGKLWRVWRKLNVMPPIVETIGTPKFEGVTDVVFGVGVSIKCKGYEHLQAHRGFCLAIEIKPSMGDDYPAVLRQIKAQRAAVRGGDVFPSHWFLLIGEFAASNVTLDQVRAIFAHDEIRVVMMSELAGD